MQLHRILIQQQQAPSAQGQFKTDSGWVGVTTYIDSHGNYRVKQEVLVAMSGITIRKY